MPLLFFISRRGFLFTAMKKKIVLSILALCLTVVVFGQQNKDSLKAAEHDDGPKACGRVIHRDNKECHTVIEAIRQKEKDTLILIPMGISLGALDKEGMHITFKFRLLRIKNPYGCEGIPARIWDVKRQHYVHRKKKKKDK